MNQPLIEATTPHKQQTSKVQICADIQAHASGNPHTLVEWGHQYTLLHHEHHQHPIAGLITQGNLQAIWVELVQAFPCTGLWPVITPQTDVVRNNSFLSVYTSSKQSIVNTTAEFFLRQSNDEDTQWYAPDFQGFQTLAQGNSTSKAWLSTPEIFPDEALLIVPTPRPADIPARLGWLGGTNFNIGPADISCVLRSWEERFGAIITHLGTDTLVAQATRPPAEEAINPLAIEHFLFCPDVVHQGSDTLCEYRNLLRKATIRGSNSWYFWWD
ncbi:DUF4253 domain-containing protein [Corynebacterium freiburgense]|uniref:DUF4253 domain-containing protein n=1 Tax=Corynebacterium freiburgense TaxID=556548 RepID=UPI0003FB72EF|nr:DUF4253 domain-containing protein [Corynebacterium freiburgense]WJZ02502.1 hypothetical protein CFREI_06060 [Corynebacterium freiburgense]